LALPSFRHHAHHLLALHLGAEAAAHAAVGAGGDDAALGLAELDHALFLSVAVGQACTQAPQDTHSDSMKSSPGADARLETASGDGQRKGALGFLAGAHAAVADDALARVVVK
jgi:hypothetical protein